ncbi:MAG TPA: hypothetical protein ACFYD3_07090 [Candidatus Hypogeohydataceae bacterium YC41]
MSYKLKTIDTNVPIPHEVLVYIENAILRYSVGLVVLDSRDDFLCAASGTFVCLRDCPAILTARHVIDKIKHNLGLALGNYTHKFILERFCLEFKSAPKGETEASGPDLGLIYINGPKVDTIKAIKSFCNLDSYGDSICKEATIPKTGGWAVFGIPEELSQIESLQKLAGRVVLAPGPDYSVRDGYDYFVFDFRPDPPSCVPSSLAGMSGGGVWHVRLLQHPHSNEVYVPRDSDWLTLSGVVYYQSPIIDGGRSLYTHGRKSVYKKLYEWA